MNYGMNPYYGAGSMYSTDPYLAHHGVKGMRWYHHLPNLPLQSVWKYALGEDTIGYIKNQADTLKARSNADKELADIDARLANKFTTKEERKNLAKYRTQVVNKRAAMSKAAEAYGERIKGSFKNSRLYKAADAVRNTTVGAAKKVYGAARTVGGFIKTAGGRALEGIRGAADRFKQMLRKRKTAGTAKKLKKNQAAASTRVTTSQTGNSQYRNYTADANTAAKLAQQYGAPVTNRTANYKGGSRAGMPSNLR